MCMRVVKSPNGVSSMRFVGGAPVATSPGGPLDDRVPVSDRLGGSRLQRGHALKTCGLRPGVASQLRFPRRLSVNCCFAGSRACKRPGVTVDRVRIVVGPSGRAGVGGPTTRGCPPGGCLCRRGLDGIGRREGELGERFVLLVCIHDWRRCQDDVQGVIVATVWGPSPRP